MFIHNIIISIFLLFIASVSNANPTIEAVNNTEHICDLTVHSSVPPYTAAQISINLKALAPNNDAQEALHKGIQNDSEEKIIAAIHAGADVNRSKEGKSPLLWAVLLKKSHAVACLLERGAVPSEPMIQYAIQLNTLRSALLIAQKCGLPINRKYQLSQNRNLTLLEVAFQQGNYETILFLIKNGVDLNEKISGISIQDMILGRLVGHCDTGTNPLILEIFQELINKGYHPNDFFGRLGGSWGVFVNKDAIQLLIKRGANPNHIFADLHNKNASWTPLLKAISEGNQKIIQFLLDSGANINLKANPPPPFNTQGPCTPLALAVNCGREDIIKILLENGAQLE